MPREDFTATYSTYEVYREENMDICLEDVLDAIEINVAGKAPASHTHSGYADVNHTHSEYAETEHTHGQSEVTGLTDALAGKAPTNHAHDYAASSHTHSQADVTNLETALSNLQTSITAVQNALSGEAASSHTHAQSEITDLATALSGLQTAINGKAESNHSHSYNDLSDQPTIPTIPSSLPANGGNADTVDSKHASDFADMNFKIKKGRRNALLF